MHIKPKKSLGQNFLVDKNIQRKIIDACALKPSDIVLEIGSGRGELTQYLALKAREVFALELDAQLSQALKDKFKDFANVEIIKQDILKLNLNKYFAKCKTQVKVIGNIPYYITTPIIEHLLKYKGKIGVIFLTVQKEFGQRITALAGSKIYGAFSCFMQYHTKPKIIFMIKKNSFFPSPKVDSCFLRLDIRPKAPFRLKDEGLLFKIIRAAFNQRRKTLRNSLKGVILPEKLNDFFKEYNIDPNIRPEALTVRDFATLTNL